MKDKMNYDIEEVKAHIATLTEVQKKIEYVRRIKADYQQAPGINITPLFNTPFDQQCDIEIGLLETQLIGKQNSSQQISQPFFKLSSKMPKTDLIRVLIAMYDLKFIEKTDGQIPDKKEFMEQIGVFFGLDLSKYHVYLTQALNQSKEANAKVFDDMKKCIEAQYYAKLNKPK